MLEDARIVPPDTELHCGVCIVGAGAAGITLALELAESGKDVVLLEAGGINWAGKSLELYEGEVLNPKRHLELDSGRYRQLGGTTSVWGGRCIPFDHIDFQPRDYVRFSGWPIDRKDLDVYYQRAHVYCECGDFAYRVSEAIPEAPPVLISGLSDGDVITSTLERWSPPTHFGKRYRNELRSAKNVRVFLNAVCLNTQVTDDGKRVSRLKISTFRGNSFHIVPKVTVLAGGGLEVTRLLLSSNTVYPNGIGNHSGWLGRGYMCHVVGIIARVELRPDAKAIFGYERDTSGIYCRRRIWISEEAQRRHRLLNIHMLLDRPLLGDPEHRSSLLSLAFLAKGLIGRSVQPVPSRGKYGLYWRHVKNILSGSPEMLFVLPKWSRDRFLDGRRLPSLLLAPKNNVYHIQFHSEQSPERTSRVTLSNRRDRFGIPRLIVDFRVSDQVVDSVCSAHHLIDRQLQRQCCGRLVYTSDDPSSLVREQRASLGHHIGTTRMAASPGEGVVDQNCRVHGLENLFVASSSVFPTSSQANPTLTIVAMAIRLADHLKAVEHV